MGVIENKIDITELERSGGGGGGGTAASVSYDNTSSGLTAANVQGAIDEVVDDLGDKAEKDQISNRNLLDNPFFTVNQRGKTTYTGTGNFGYTVDRWAYVMSSDSTVEVTNNGVEITIDSGSADNAFAQVLDNLGQAINGRTATLSAIIDGTLYSGSLETFAPPESGWKVETYFDTDGIRGELARNVSGTTQILIRLPKDGTGRVITAMKLEIGSVSTLEMDTIPNYAEELLKCQRYFQRVTAGNIVTSIFPGYALTANGARFALPLLPMRAVPTVTPSAVTSFGASKNTAANAVIPDTITVSGRFGNTVVIELSKTGGFTAESVYMFCQTVSGAYLDLSADL